METGNRDEGGSCLKGCVIDNYSMRKLLPCFHVVCVEHLREFNRNGEPSNKNACPRCHVTFVVPSRALDSLPDNFLGRRIERLNKISMNWKMKAGSDGKGNWKIVNDCDICSRQSSGGRSVSSVAHCLDCGQNLCETCLTSHTGMRLSRNHEVIRAEAYDGLGVAELLTSRDRPCETHPSQLERIFCEVCQVPMCTKCCAEEWHRGHAFHPMSRTSDEARSWIVDQLSWLEEAKTRARQLLESVEVERMSFEENVKVVMAEVNNMGQQMLESASTVAQRLREELNHHRDRCTSDMSKLLGDVRSRYVEAEQLEGIVRMIMELIPDSSSAQVAKDLNRIVMQLMTRSPESFLDQEEKSSSPSPPPRADHFLPIVDEAMNDDMETITGDIGELRVTIQNNVEYSFL